MSEPTRVLIVHHPSDGSFLEELQTHLRPLARDGLINPWDDTQIVAGAEWAREIASAVANAHVALLLVSADLLGSDNLHADVLAPLMLRAEDEGVRIVPVLAGACDFGESPLSRYQPVLPDARPLRALTRARRDEVYVKVAQMLASRAKAAVPALPRPPAERKYQFVPRPAVEDACLQKLQERWLLLLAPRQAGSSSTLKRVVARSGFGEAVTWLSPPTLPGCTEAQYFASLTRDAAVTNPFEYEAWQRKRAAAVPHLIVISHDGGPVDHLEALGAMLRRLKEGHDGQFSLLVEGKGSAADLRFNSRLKTSLFAGMPFHHLPPLSAEEVEGMLAAAGEPGKALAREIHGATDGHPGFLRPVVTMPDALGHDRATEVLAESPEVLGILAWRLDQDNADGCKGDLHTRHVLKTLLAGGKVRRLGAALVMDRLKFPEVRLYYDALVREEGGATVFRCEAVRRAAEMVMDAGDGG